VSGGVEHSKAKVRITSDGTLEGTHAHVIQPDGSLVEIPDIFSIEVSLSWQRGEPPTATLRLCDPEVITDHEADLYRLKICMPDPCCPVCGERPVVRCKCLLGDMRCAHGHHWHTCPVHKKIVLREANHETPEKCSCV
jgi:hypothetical protein